VFESPLLVLDSANPMKITGETVMRTNTIKRRQPGFARARTGFILCLAVLLGACTMSETGQRVGSGAAIGALGGALLGGDTEGAVIGAAVGAAGGYVVDQRAKRSDSESENAQLRAENERLRRETADQ